MTQTQAEQPYAEVDPYDPDDASAVEIAVGLAVAEALAHPPDVRSMSAPQAEKILESAVGLTLRMYAHRVLQLMSSQWLSAAPPRPAGVPLDRAYDPIEPAVTAAVRQAIDETGESVRDLIAAARARAVVTVTSEPPAALMDLYRDTTGGKAELARADVVEQGYNDPEAQALDRLRVGMNSVSRVLVTRTRETAKDRYATSVGAVGAVWRTRRDTRVRNSHGDLEGDFVPLGEPFHTVSGATIRRPGDPKAPLHETIGCRCRLSYRLPPL